MIRTSEFLAAFRSPDEPLQLRAFRPRNAVASIHNAAQIWTTSLTDLALNPVLQRELKEKNKYCGLYFVPNVGGDCDEQITRFVAWFVESDSLPLEEQHKKLDTAPIQPSIRVETRKSVHAYWLIAGDCSEQQWREVQSGLIASCDGDPKIRNPARLMRLPHFYHLHQNGNGVERKKVVVRTFEPTREYTVAEMLEAFPAPPEDSPSLPPPPLPHNGPFDTWAELNTEAGIRIRNLTGARVNRKGWTQAPGHCHGSADGKALFVAPDGAYGCHNKCSGETIRLALGLPAGPLASRDRVNNSSSKNREDDLEPPLSLPAEMLPVPALTPSLLPESLRPWLVDITERMQCPLEFPSIAALVALASVNGNRVRIQPKRADDWTVVPNLWGAIVARPGYLKTPALEAALLPLRHLEKVARAKYAEKVKDFMFGTMVADAQKKELEQKIRGAVRDGKDTARFKEQLKKTVAEDPIEQRYIVNDSTVEKLGELLNENPRGLLLLRDELVGWFKSLERDGHQQDRAFYLETWNGSGDFVWDRIGRGTTRIDNMTVSILGAIQPGPLRSYLHGALAEGTSDDGLMQRFQLAVYPDTSVEWENVDRVPNAKAAKIAQKCFQDLDSRAAQIEKFESLRFDAQAQAFFNEWRKDLETTLRDGSLEHAALEGHLAKYRSLMPTLALLFHLCDGNTDNVSLRAAEMAAAWCSFLEAHAQRIYGLALTAEVHLAKAIVHKIEKGQLPGKFTARDIYRKGWAGLSTPTEVRDPLRILVDHNYLKVLLIPTTAQGGKPTELYLAHPSLLEAF